MSESLLSPDVRERELRPFMQIKDHYDKMVLSMDRSYINTYEGIKFINIIDWLLEDTKT